MMDKDVFKEREHSLEEGYFRQHEAKLIEKLRERAEVDKIVEALAVKLQTDDPVLLRRIMALGVTLDTGAAFLLAPLVQVAWAGGAVTDREREKVLRQRLKTISSELGETDDEGELGAYLERIDNAAMPEEARKAALKQVKTAAPAK